MGVMTDILQANQRLEESVQTDTEARRKEVAKDKQIKLLLQRELTSVFSEVFSSVDCVETAKRFLYDMEQRIEIVKHLIDFVFDIYMPGGFRK